MENRNSTVPGLYDLLESVIIEPDNDVSEKNDEK